MREAASSVEGTDAEPIVVQFSVGDRVCDELEDLRRVNVERIGLRIGDGRKELVLNAKWLLMRVDNTEGEGRRLTERVERTRMQIVGNNQSRHS